MNVSSPGSLLPESWKVRLPVFEGPLDLLLHLVRINEVEITDIPVAKVCDQFQEYLRLMEELNLDIAAEYIYEAALLIHLKSRMLLPHPALPGSADEDPRQALVTRLVEYRRLKDAAHSLAEADRVRHGIWTRSDTSLPGAEPELDLGEISLYDLLQALQRVLVHYRREHPEPLLVPTEVFSVREQFERLLGVLDAGRPHRLLEDLRGRSGRAEIVATFLAVLELARLSLVRLHQTVSGEILLYRTTRDLQRHELEAIEG